MKIFITGIAGFLGSHLAKRLEKLGHEISGNDTLNSICRRSSGIISFCGYDAKHKFRRNEKSS